MNPVNQEPNAQYLVYTNQSPEQKPKKKKHGCLIAFLVVLGVFILAGAIATPFIIKEVKYASAEILVEANEFDNAIVMFESLGSYRDSADQITKTRYLQAKYYAEDEDYVNAIDVLQEINPYEDSEELLEEYVVGYMDALAEDKEFDELEDYIEIARDLDGSDELEEACDYYEALILFDDGKMEEAAKAFAKLDCKDSEKYYAIAAQKYYEESYEMVDSKETLESLFKKLEKYKSDKEIDEMLCSNIYNIQKLIGEWKCDTGNQSLLFSNADIQINVPVKLDRSKNYFIAGVEDYIVAVNAKDTKDLVVLFEIKSFDEPDVLNPNKLCILNQADKKEYTFTRVK